MTNNAVLPAQGSQIEHKGQVHTVLSANWVVLTLESPTGYIGVVPTASVTLPEPVAVAPIEDPFAAGAARRTQPYFG